MKPTIGGYKPLTPMQTVGSGSARWCIAERGGESYFVKEFLAPVYPTGAAGTPLYQKQKERCEAFERRKKRIYAALTCVIGDTLVPVTDFFCWERHYFAVSEAVPAPHLTGEDVLKNGMKEKRELLLTLAICLQRLHAQGVVHADLKPEHVLLTPMPEGYRVRLIDMDSSFLAEEPPERELEGDPVYLSPEVYLRIAGENAEVGTKADTFALGAMIHRLWTGELPRFDERFAYLHEAALSGADISLSPQLPAAYRYTVRQMLLPSPKDRPSDTEVVAVLSAPYRAGDDEKPNVFCNGLSKYMRV